MTGRWTRLSGKHAVIHTLARMDRVINTLTLYTVETGMLTWWVVHHAKRYGLD